MIPHTHLNRIFNHYTCDPFYMNQFVMAWTRFGDHKKRSDQVTQAIML